MTHKGLKEFWSDITHLEYTPLESIQSEIIKYLNWCDEKDAEIDRLRKELLRLKDEKFFGGTLLQNSDQLHPIQPKARVNHIFYGPGEVLSVGNEMAAVSFDIRNGKTNVVETSTLEVLE